MGRTVIADQKLEEYLTQFADDGKFHYGLIIGQPSSQNKDYVVHLVKTSNDSIRIKEPEEDEPPRNDNIQEEINSEAVVHHLISVTRMIPGSFFVLGIFVVDKENIFEKNERLSALKNCIGQFNSALKEAKFIFGKAGSQSSDEKIILFYSSLTKELVCKNYNEKSDNLSPVEWKFVKSPIEWHLFESSYELDDTFPLVETDNGIDLEGNFNESIKNITSCIECSQIFIQNEKVDENILLETYIKTKKGKKEEIDSFKASIFLPELVSCSEPIKLEKFQGTVRFSGTITSRIWSHQKNSFKRIEEFIRNDVLRSLVARVQIYCDSLTNTTVSRDEFFSEPPRRVFFNIPESGGIQCSEYLFRNELPDVAVEQAKEILDLNISPEEVFMDCEGLPVVDDSVSMVTTPSQAKRRTFVTEISKHMYIIGIATALLVLVISVGLNFIFR